MSRTKLGRAGDWGWKITDDRGWTYSYDKDHKKRAQKAAARLQKQGRLADVEAKDSYSSDPGYMNPKPKSIG